MFRTNQIVAVGDIVRQRVDVEDAWASRIDSEAVVVVAGVGRVRRRIVGGDTNVVGVAIGQRRRDRMRSPGLVARFEC